MNKRFAMLFFIMTVFCSGWVEAQFSVGSRGFTILSGTKVNINNLTWQPSTDATISNNNLSLGHTAIPGTPTNSILRVYEWDESLLSDGIVGLFTSDPELNGNTLVDLQVAYNDTSGNNGFIISTSSTVIDTSFYVYLALPGATEIKQITATGYGVALPVTWLYFTASAQQGTALLNWKVAFEKKVDKYIVQRSNDGRSFTDIAAIDPKCNDCTTPVEYHYTDKEPLKDNNLYRIKEQSMDGNFSYSQTRILIFDHTNTIRMSPNPAHTFIQISGLDSKSYRIHISDINGRVILNEQVENEDRHRIDLSEWAKGVYVVNIISKYGKTDVFKFTKL